MSTHQYGRRVMHDPRDAGYLRDADDIASHPLPRRGLGTDSRARVGSGIREQA